MMPDFPTYTLEQALAMLPDGPMIDTRYETVPNCGISKCATMHRNDLIVLMKLAADRDAIYESGPEGIKIGFTIHLEVINYRDYSRGNLFVKTRNKN